MGFLLLLKVGATRSRRLSLVSSRNRIQPLVHERLILPRNSHARDVHRLQTALSSHAGCAKQRQGEAQVLEQARVDAASFPQVDARPEAGVLQEEPPAAAHLARAQACVQRQQREEERDNVGRERELEVRVGQLHWARAATWRHGYTRERRSEEARATESARLHVSSILRRSLMRCFARPMLALRVLPHAAVGVRVRARPVRVVLRRLRSSRVAALSEESPPEAVNDAEDEAFLLANFSPWVTDQAGAKRCLAFLREKEQVRLDTAQPLCFQLFFTALFRSASSADKRRRLF